jgi:hypothetical protein
MEENPAVYYRVWGLDYIAYGPVELPTLVSWIRDERVQPDTWIYREEQGDWVRAREMVEIKTLFKRGAGGGAPAAKTPSGMTPAALRRIKIFAEMDDRQLTSFLQYMEVLKLLPNAVIFRKGEQGDAMFLVLEGEVRARVLIDGRESTLSTLGVGECFGEIAVLDQSPRSADVVANVESVLLKVSAGALKRVFEEAPALAAPFLLALSRALTSRVRSLTKRYEDSIHFSRTATEK